MTLMLRVNGHNRPVAVDGDKPLLWTLREDLKLTGAKFGCGVGVCRACTVLADGKATVACVTSTRDAVGAEILTIEGLGATRLQALQAAWIAEDVPQCGYCQPGMIMAAAALLTRTPNPTEAELVDGLPNICRCGTYDRIAKAVRRGAAMLAGTAA